jgi:hypothetical protein
MSMLILGAAVCVGVCAGVLSAEFLVPRVRRLLNLCVVALALVAVIALSAATSPQQSLVLEWAVPFAITAVLCEARKWQQLLGGSRSYWWFVRVGLFHPGMLRSQYAASLREQSAEHLAARTEPGS